MHLAGRLSSALIAAIALLLLQSSAGAVDHEREAGPGRVFQHVFVVVLENEGYDKTFGANSPAPYLSTTLPRQGVLLSQYYGTGHVSLDNYIAMISGQAASVQTRADCQTYADFVMTGMTADGQAIGTGCVYPASVKTIADQLTQKGRTWRAYAEDMGNDPNREAARCGHPQIGAVDLTQSSEAPSSAVPLGDQYAARHNPFVYFHSIIDSPACDANVVNFSSLQQDLQSEETTANFTFITPNLCDDGHDAPCKNGQPGGLVSADAFLQKWVPIITAAPAYRRDGLLVIVFDEGGLSVGLNPAGGYLISAPGQSCCNQQPGPNLGAFPQSSTLGPYTLEYQSFGGDRTGAVLLSPFLKGGTVSNTPFNHYSLLKTIEDIFDVDGYLGYAGQPGLVGFFGCARSDIAAPEEAFDGCAAR